MKMFLHAQKKKKCFNDFTKSAYYRNRDKIVVGTRKCLLQENLVEF